MKKVRIALWIILIFAVASYIGGNESSKSGKSTSYSTYSSSSVSRSTSYSTHSSTSRSSTASSSKASSSSVSIGKQNALKSAKDYLRVSAFSRSGLIEQLEFEGYTNEEAVYAVDNCGANWKEQAAKCAKSYLSIMSFSRSGLIEQLEFEGFTSEQAIYGVTQNGY